MRQGLGVCWGRREVVREAGTRHLGTKGDPPQSAARSRKILGKARALDGLVGRGVSEVRQVDVPNEA